jgi:hypothetical protein
VPDFSSFCVDWAPDFSCDGIDFLPGFSSECVDFIPDEGSFPSRFDGVGVLFCCVAAPPCSRLVLSCAIANPELAISAIAAAETKKLLLITYLLTWHCPDRKRGVR